MSATLKSGLIFGLVGLIAVIVVGFVPIVGALLCGPITALVIGGLAGYFARRWSDQPTGVGQGVLAATIAGVGTLIGTALFIIIAYNLQSSNPAFQAMLDQAIQQQLQQQPETNVSAEDVQTMLGTIVPVGGFCFGVINLVIALVGGLIGALIGNRPANTISVVPPAPPTVPPVG